MSPLSSRIIFFLAHCSAESVWDLFLGTRILISAKSIYGSSLKKGFSSKPPQINSFKLIKVTAPKFFYDFGAHESLF